MAGLSRMMIEINPDHCIQGPVSRSIRNRPSAVASVPNSKVAKCLVLFWRVHHSLEKLGAFFFVLRNTLYLLLTLPRRDIIV